MSVRSTDKVTILEATDYEGSFLPLGLSDHSAFGISEHRDRVMIERHIMLPDVPCEDEKFSSTPEHFEMYVRALRD